MKSKYIFATLLLAAAPLALAGQPAGQDKPPLTQQFNSTVPATGVSRIKIEVQVGQVRILAAKTESIEIRSVASASHNQMHFIFDWSAGNPEQPLPQGLHLVTRQQGDTLVVELRSDEDGSVAPDAGTANGGGDEDKLKTGHGPFGWKSDWTVRMPAGIAVDLVLGAGEADIYGLSGGVSANVGAGKLDAQLAKGPLEAKVGAGEVTASVLSADYGSVSLSSGVGNVEFEVRGSPERTGYDRSIIGARQSLTGTGDTAYKLTAGAGQVGLKLGVQKLVPPDSRASPDSPMPPASPVPPGSRDAGSGGNRPAGFRH